VTNKFETANLRGIPPKVNDAPRRKIPDLIGPPNLATVKIPRPEEITGARNPKTYSNFSICNNSLPKQDVTLHASEIEACVSYGFSITIETIEEQGNKT
jgi:hypothetical protein